MRKLEFKDIGLECKFKCQSDIFDIISVLNKLLGIAQAEKNEDRKCIDAACLEMSDLGDKLKHKIDGLIKRLEESGKYIADVEKLKGLTNLDDLGHNLLMMNAGNESELEELLEDVLKAITNEEIRNALSFYQKNIQAAKLLFESKKREKELAKVKQEFEVLLEQWNSMKISELDATQINKKTEELINRYLVWKENANCILMVKNAIEEKASQYANSTETEEQIRKAFKERLRELHKTLEAFDGTEIDIQELLNDISNYEIVGEQGKEQGKSEDSGSKAKKGKPAQKRKPSTIIITEIKVDVAKGIYIFSVKDGEPIKLNISDKKQRENYGIYLTEKSIADHSRNKGVEALSSEISKKVAPDKEQLVDYIIAHVLNTIDTNQKNCKNQLRYVQSINQDSGEEKTIPIVYDMRGVEKGARQHMEKIVKAAKKAKMTSMFIEGGKKRRIGGARGDARGKAQRGGSLEKDTPSGSGKHSLAYRLAGLSPFSQNKKPAENEIDLDEIAYWLRLKDSSEEQEEEIQKLIDEGKITEEQAIELYRKFKIGHLEPKEEEPEEEEQEAEEQEAEEQEAEEQEAEESEEEPAHEENLDREMQDAEIEVFDMALKIIKCQKAIKDAGRDLNEVEVDVTDWQANETEYKGLLAKYKKQKEDGKPFDDWYERQSKREQLNAVRMYAKDLESKFEKYKKFMDENGITLDVSDDIFAQLGVTPPALAAQKYDDILEQLGVTSPAPAVQPGVDIEQAVETLEEKVRKLIGKYGDTKDYQGAEKLAEEFRNAQVQCEEYKERFNGEISEGNGELNLILIDISMYGGWCEELAIACRAEEVFKEYWDGFHDMSEYDSWLTSELENERQRIEKILGQINLKVEQLVCAAECKFSQKDELKDFLERNVAKKLIVACNAHIDFIDYRIAERKTPLIGPLRELGRRAARVLSGGKKATKHAIDNIQQPSDSNKQHEESRSEQSEQKTKNKEALEKLKEKWDEIKQKESVEVLTDIVSDIEAEIKQLEENINIYEGDYVTDCTMLEKEINKKLEEVKIELQIKKVIEGKETITLELKTEILANIDILQEMISGYVAIGKPIEDILKVFGFSEEERQKVEETLKGKQRQK